MDSGVKRMLTVAELASLYSLSTDTIYRLVRARALPFIKIGGSLRFDAAEVAVALSQKQSAQNKQRE